MDDDTRTSTAMDGQDTTTASDQSARNREPALSEGVISFAGEDDNNSNDMIATSYDSPQDTKDNTEQPAPRNPIIYSWGRGDLGALFHSAASNQLDGFHAFDSVATSRTFRSVASNIYHSAAVTTTGELYTCGCNTEGQVTDDTPPRTDCDEQPHIYRPRMMESLSHQRVLSVACGLHHTVVVTASGCAMSFGGNESGQLGHSSSTHSSVRPKVVSYETVQGGRVGPIVVKKAVCGDLFTLLLTTAGTVYGCGSAVYLGNPLAIDERGTCKDTICPAERVEPLLASQIVDIVAGAEHSLALSWDNNLFTWGNNKHCELGFRCSEEYSSARDTTSDMIVDPIVASYHQQLPKKVELPQITSHEKGNDLKSSPTTQYIVGMAAGGQHSVLWTSDGVLLGAGSNKFGQLALMVPVSDSFCPVNLGMEDASGVHTKCLMAACGATHTLVLATHSLQNANDGAVDTQVLAFGSNANGQITGVSASSMFRTPAEVYPQDLQPRFRESAARLDSILMVAAGGDQSFVIGANCEGVSVAPNYYATSIYSSSSLSSSNVGTRTAAKNPNGENCFLGGIGGSLMGGMLLKKQFSSVASSALEPMNANALHNLLIKAVNDKAADAASEPTLLTTAMNTVSELFSSPSLLAGSFAVDPAKAETLVFSGGDIKALVSSNSDSSNASIHSFSATDAIEALSSSMIFDIEGVEQCYTTLTTMGTNAVARLVAAFQQSITELEHAAGSGISPGKNDAVFSGWRFGLNRPPSASGDATMLPDSAYRVFMLIWQSPIMGNPNMSADLMTRLLTLVDGQQHCHAMQEHLNNDRKPSVSKTSKVLVRNKLVAMLLQYPDHILVSRILKPLQQHLTYHIHAAEGGNANIISSSDSSTVSISIRMICRALVSVHVANKIRPFASPEAFYNDGIAALPDPLLLQDYKRWLSEQRVKVLELQKNKRKNKLGRESSDGSSSSKNSSSHIPPAPTAADHTYDSSLGTDGPSIGVNMEIESDVPNQNCGGATSADNKEDHVETDGEERADGSEDDILTHLEQAVGRTEASYGEDDFNIEGNSSSSDVGLPPTERSKGGGSDETRSFCLSSYPFLLSAKVKRRMLHFFSFQQQRSAQSQAFFGGLASGMGMFQPWFLLPIQRDHLMQQALIHLTNASNLDLKKPMKVVFIGEEGIDEGGVRKEFFQLLMQQLFAQDYAMFQTAPSGRVLWINQSNVWSDDEFRLVGTMLALAVYNDVLLDVHLPSVFYKKILNRHDVSLADLKGLDPELHRGLVQLLQYEPKDDVEMIFCRSFVVEWEEFGAKNVHELIPNGENIPVTGDNREQYVQLLVQWLLVDSIRQQFTALKEGFARVVDREAMLLFTAQELELVMTGTPHLDFKEMQQHTEYIGPEDWNADSVTVQAFWRVLHSLSLEEKQKFLLFVTGSMKAPIGGLKNINLKIQRMGPDSQSLPTAHTCFNTMLLPAYEDEGHLRNRLLTAINECSGFGLK